MLSSGSMAASGRLGIQRIPGRLKAPLSWRLRNLIAHRLSDWPRLAVAHLARWCGVPVMLSRLRVEVITYRNGVRQVVDYGVVGTRVVTTAGVNYIVDAFQNAAELENLRYHGIGTGAVAEAAADTALGAESTTALNPDSTRATGTLTEGASANIFRTVGVVTVDASVAMTEHGIFNAAATGGGTLLDRTVFSVVNLLASDSVQFTYELTLSAGG